MSPMAHPARVLTQEGQRHGPLPFDLGDLGVSCGTPRVNSLFDDVLAAGVGQGRQMADITPEPEIDLAPIVAQIQRNGLVIQQLAAELAEIQSAKRRELMAQTIALLKASIAAKTAAAAQAAKSRRRRICICGDPDCACGPFIFRASM